MNKIDIETIKELAINTDIMKLSEVAEIKQLGNKIIINLGFYSDELAYEIKNLVESRYTGVDIEINTVIETKVVQKGVTANKNIKNIIAVASGKGGVGKSSTSVNLAIALSQSGAKVGILDADIYGPSIPTMLGTNKRPETEDGKIMKPVIAHNLQSNSVGYLVDADSAMIWRAPMAVGALQQLINDTKWQELDYLVVDLPPGTGDIQLTMSQKIPVTGAVTVTTPQDISLADAKRSIDLFNKVNIDNIGIIENMSTHVCSNCGNEEHIFGTGGGKKMADKLNIELLGEIPLDIRIREGLDNGMPILISDSDDKISKKYKEIALKIAIKLAKKDKSYSQAFGNIKVENK